jgi:hypothetical protein
MPSPSISLVPSPFFVGFQTCTKPRTKQLSFCLWVSLQQRFGHCAVFLLFHSSAEELCGDNPSPPIIIVDAFKSNMV